jgi:secondary thiamine-phosphate synthase enzyme
MLQRVRIHQRQLTISPRGPGLHPITAEVAQVVSEAGMTVGLCTIFIRHTSASLVIQENADPSVRADLQRFFARLVPAGGSAGGDYEHDAEGPDDMPGHIKSALTQTVLSVPLVDGKLGLGTWQGIYLWEHRSGAHRRSLIVQVLGQVLEE